MTYKETSNRVDRHEDHNRQNQPFIELGGRNSKEGAPDGQFDYADCYQEDWLTYEVQLHSCHVDIWVNIANVLSTTVSKLCEDYALTCPG
jgi:hypothetical protein